MTITTPNGTCYTSAKNINFVSFERTGAWTPTWTRGQRPNVREESPGDSVAYNVLKNEHFLA
ncbi:MAG: hypothetical protein IJU76_09575 [Desulfovibrionaceae bacterium]|nr:hypothetical protein [Desulfovibrionaceae bacterium]